MIIGQRHIKQFFSPDPIPWHRPPAVAYIHQRTNGNRPSQPTERLKTTHSSTRYDATLGERVRRNAVKFNGRLGPASCSRNEHKLALDRLKSRD
jgi:hypothetical protein